jgi:hypothetical protein
MPTLTQVLRTQKLMAQTGGFSHDFSPGYGECTQKYALQDGRSKEREGDIVLKVGIGYYTDPETGDERIVLI